MSLYDREYMKDEDRNRRSGGPATWDAVIWLIVINVTVYLLHNVIFYDPRRDLFGLSLEALKSLRLWTPLTYQFIHANLWHLLGNLIFLYSAGRILLQHLSSRQVWKLYLYGGLVGGFFQVIWNLLFVDSPIVGASGSVLAVVFALTTLLPDQRIHFFSMASLTLRQVAWLLIAINAFTLLLTFGSVDTKDKVAVMTHFGGMLLGWATIRYGRHRKTSTVPKKAATAKRRSSFGVRILRDGEEATSPGTETTTKKPFVTSDVDAILDKINEHGFQSLTPEERLTLEQSSRKLSRRIDGDS